MKILLKGYYGFGNLGDDVLMIETYSIVRRVFPEAEYYLFCNYNENLSGFRQIPGYQQYVLSLLANLDIKLIDWTYKGSFDILVDGGGGVYFDKRKGGWWTFCRNRILAFMGCKNVFRLDKLLRAILRKESHLYYKVRIGFGLGIGPYHAEAPLLHRHLSDLGSYKGLIVRDDISISVLQSFKFRAAVFKYTDIVFRNYTVRSCLKSVPVRSPVVKRIGIILMDWEERMLERFTAFEKFASDLVQSGFGVHFFSLDENYDREFVKKFGPHFTVHVWRPNTTSVGDFLERIAQQDVLFTARAHGAILGGLLGAIPICLGVSPKLIEVSKMFGNVSLLVEEPFDQYKLRSVLDAVVNDLVSFRSKLEIDCAVNNSLALAAERKLIELLEYHGAHL